MGSAAWRDAPVISLGGRPHAKPATRASILVAAWEYRVNGTECRSTGLNVFQRAVLGLIAAGVTGYREIGAHLVLDPQLVAHVAGELLHRQLIIQRPGTVAATEAGLAALRSGRSDEEVPISRSVFVEAWSGTLLRGWEERRRELEAEPLKGPWYDVELGSRGRPRIVRTLALLPERMDAPRPPDLAALGRVFSDGRDASPPFHVLDAPEVARPVLIATEVYTVGAQHGTGWYVADLFREGSSPELRWEVERRSKEDGRLEKHLKRVLAAGQGAETLQAQLRAARERVRAALPGIAHRHPELLEALASYEIERDGAGGDRPQGTASAALAALFRDWARACPTDGRAGDIPDPTHDGTAIRELVRGLGAKPIPLVLETVTADALQRACDRHEGDLVALAGAAALSAAHHPAHPLREVLEREPAALAWIVSFEPGEFTDREDFRLHLDDPFLHALLGGAPELRTSDDVQEVEAPSW
jgi:hypothetical protein